MFYINRINKIFLIMLVSLLCGFISVNAVNAKAVNQATNIPSEQLAEAQSPYSFYYYGAVDLAGLQKEYTKQTLELKLDECAVRYKQGITLKERDAFNAKRGVEIVAHEKTADIYIVRPPNNVNVQEMLTVYGGSKTISASVYGNDYIVQYAHPVFISPSEEKRMTVTDRFIVQFGPEVSEKDVASFNDKHHVVIVEKDYWAPLRYLLQITPASDLDVLKMASLYHQQSFVEYATPDFYFPRSFSKASPEGRGPKLTGGLPHKASPDDPGRRAVRIPAEHYDRPIKVKMFEKYGFVYTRGTIYVGLKRDITPEQAHPLLQNILDKYQGKLVRDFGQGFYKPRLGASAVIVFPDFVDIFILRSILDRITMFRYATLGQIGRTNSTRPNDTYFFNGDQWALENITTTSADISAPEAWDIETGKPNVVIAILDSGIAMNDGIHLSHPDLNEDSKIILGPDYIGDGNGVKDENGHGTAVAGIAAAETDNGVGIAGVAGITWSNTHIDTKGCKLLIIQTAGIDGSAYPEEFVEGVSDVID